jgi:hypothetical protein
MTQFVFALVTMMGQQTISTEYFESIDVCLWYSSRLNKQHHHTHHFSHDLADKHVFAQCIPTRVNPDDVTIYNR